MAYDPKPETQRKSQIRNPKKTTQRGFCFRISGLGFPSDFGFRIPNLPSLRLCVSAVQILCLLLLISCDKTNPATTGPQTVPAGTGVIRGVVKFIGTPPVMNTIGGACCPGSTPVVDESLAVNADGAMKNIVVFIKDGPNLAGPPPTDALLTQRNCQYVPHVLALRTGQDLVVTSHDPTLHNVHIQADANPSENFSESNGATHTVVFQQPELVRIKCDVHPWMTAYAYVFDHPCFAVTGDDGRFELRNLPPGTYTLVAWQEKLDTQEMQVTVSADKPSEVKFEYRGQ
jgi:hypothetical protein